MTGSFLEAILAGMRPAMKVRSMLMAMRIIAPAVGRTATPLRLVRLSMMALIGSSNSRVIPMPTKPAHRPMESVSALNTREMSRLEAPMERSTPISRVRSKTEI